MPRNASRKKEEGSEEVSSETEVPSKPTVTRAGRTVRKGPKIAEPMVTPSKAKSSARKTPAGGQRPPGPVPKGPSYVITVDTSQDELEEIAKTKRIRLKGLQEELKALKLSKRNQELEQELAEALEKNDGSSKLREELAAALKERDEYKVASHATKARLEEEIKRLETECEAERTKLQQMKRELEAARDTTRSHDKGEKERLTERVQQLELTKRDLESRLSELQRENTTLADTQNALNTQRDRLETRKAELHNKLKERDQEIRSLKEKMGELVKGSGSSAASSSSRAQDSPRGRDPPPREDPRATKDDKEYEIEAKVTEAVRKLVKGYSAVNTTLELDLNRYLTQVDDLTQEVEASLSGLALERDLEGEVQESQRLHQQSDKLVGALGRQAGMVKKRIKTITNEQRGTAQAAPPVLPAERVPVGDNLDEPQPSSSAWGASSSSASEGAPFHDFPQPWNVALRRPPPGAGRNEDQESRERGVTPVFSGRPHEYSQWRSSFIEMIHRAPCELHIKIMALIKHLRGAETNKQRIRGQIVEGIEYTMESYLKAIKRLEFMFGESESSLSDRCCEIYAIRDIKEGETRKMEKFLSKLEDYLDICRSQGSHAELMSRPFYISIITCFSRSYQERFYIYSDEERKEPKGTTSGLIHWIRRELKRAITLDALPTAGAPPISKSANTQKKFGKTSGYKANEDKKQGTKRKADDTDSSAQTNNSSTNDSKKKKTGRGCSFCKGTNHAVWKCKEFAALTGDEKKAFVLQAGLCYNCLKPSHLAEDCNWDGRCSACEGKHHSKLHGLSFHVGSPEPSSDQSYLSVGCAQALKGFPPVSVRILPAYVRNPKNGKKKAVNVFLDNGNHGNLMSNKLASELGMSGFSYSTRVGGVMGMNKKATAVVALIQLSSWDGTMKDRKIAVKVLPSPAGNMKAEPWAHHAKEFEHLKDIPFFDPVPGEPIGLMLGANSPDLHSGQAQDVEGKPGEPVAQKCRLGWTMFGPKRKEDVWDENSWPEDFAMTAMQEFEFTEDGETRPVHPILTLSATCSEPLTKPEDVCLDKLLKLWLSDELEGTSEGDALAPSREDRYVQELLQKKTTLEDGRFAAPVLWKLGHPLVKNNYKMALKRLYSLEASRHFKKKHIKSLYCQLIRGWLVKHYVRKIELPNPEEVEGCFIPHFPVVREDKGTTKVRPVMDCSAKGSGRSLNDAILTGPSLMNDLVQVLLRFRKHPIALSADVSDMFLRIKLLPEDRKYHRFLWRENPGDKIEIYEFLSHVFGNAGSPCVAMTCIRELAQKFQQTFPRAAEMIVDGALMDDLMDSFETEAEAIQIMKQLREIFQAAGMKLGKVISNSKRLLDGLNPDEISPSLDLAALQEARGGFQLVKTLGVIYLASEDSFSFSMVAPAEEKWTKRLMLRCFAALYDPNGWIIPFSIRPRKIFQELWLNALPWDKQLPDHQGSMWNLWLAELQDLPTLRFPRCLVPKRDSKVASMELHVFADASSKAYGAAAYLVVTYKDGVKISTLALARGRLAPLKSTTIPRLELRAAFLGALVKNQAQGALQIPDEDIYCWSDAKTVLCWLQTQSKQLQTYVANRVDKILSRTLLDQWRWVPTDFNPADIISRGSTLRQLATSELWHQGPSFLKGCHEGWPEKVQIVKTDEVEAEMKKESQIMQMGEVFYSYVSICAKTEGDDYVQRVHTGDWRKMVRVIAFVRRVMRRRARPTVEVKVTQTLLKDTAWYKRQKVDSHKRREHPSTMKITHYNPSLATHVQPLTSQELADAETAILRSVQLGSLPELVKRLRSRDLAPESEYAKVSPRFHSDGLIRIFGRMHTNPHLAFETRCPVLLPPKHPIVPILLLHAHEVVNKHVGGAATAQASFTSRYWANKTRCLAKGVTSTCVKCRKKGAKVSNQRQAPLPDYRIKADEIRAEAFKYTAVDAAGPFLVKIGRSHHKRWLLLFTCCQYRAIHVEVMSQINTGSFLMAFDRFLARRSRPCQMISDNGPNFVRADVELKKMWNEISQTDLQAKFPDIKWTFNPPVSPHKGGVFERMIRSMKEALAKVLPPGDVNDEEMLTAVAIAEGLVNSRPLMALNPSDGDEVPITPAHFLYGGPYAGLAPLDSIDGSTFTARWKKIQSIMDDFWKSFLAGMVPHLQQINTNWKGKRRNMTKGDVVVILDEKNKGNWPMGVVDKVYPHSRDGLVRVFDVKVAGKIRQRSINHVILLVPAEE